MPLTPDLGRAFLYARCNAELSHAGLAALGVKQANPDAVQELDNVAPDNIYLLFDIGAAVGTRVTKAHSGSFVS